jgi:molybdopterin synthase catalytic subunit
MGLQKISDAEFLELWEAHRSVAKIAKITGMAERALHERRRSIEGRHGVQLIAQKNDVTKALGNINLGLENGTVIVFSDAHFNGKRTTAFKALLWLIDELKPKVVINNGDAFDGASISRHPVSGWENTPSVFKN